MKNSNWILLSFFFAIALPLQAQLNFKVGFNVGYANPEVHHQIYQRYNADRPWLTKQLKEFQTLSGQQLGIRYKLEKYIGFELNWQNQYHRKKAKGENPSTGSNFTQSVSFRYSSIGLGFEQFIKSFSWGASFNFDRIHFKTETTDIDKFSVLKDNGWSSHFFISLNVEGNETLHLSIRPFVHFPWSKFNLRQLNDELNPTDTSRDLEQDYLTYGLMLIFYNGL